jgi:hypothetical protein
LSALVAALASILVSKSAAATVHGAHAGPTHRSLVHSMLIVDSACRAESPATLHRTESAQLPALALAEIAGISAIHLAILVTILVTILVAILAVILRAKPPPAAPVHGAHAAPTHSKLSSSLTKTTALTKTTGLPKLPAVLHRAPAAHLRAAARAKIAGESTIHWAAPGSALGSALGSLLGFTLVSVLGAIVGPVLRPKSAPAEPGHGAESAALAHHRSLPAKPPAARPAPVISLILVLARLLFTSLDIATAVLLLVHPLLHLVQLCREALNLQLQGHDHLSIGIVPLIGPAHAAAAWATWPKTIWSPPVATRAIRELLLRC